jgi:hypothetical protein
MVGGLPGVEEQDRLVLDVPEGAGGAGVGGAAQVEADASVAD